MVLFYSPDKDYAKLFILDLRLGHYRVSVYIRGVWAIIAAPQGVSWRKPNPPGSKDCSFTTW